MKKGIKALLTQILKAIEPVQPYQIRTVTKTDTIDSKSGKSFSLSVPSIAGYTPVGVVRWSQNHGNNVYVTSQPSYSSFYLHNEASSAQSTTLSVDILYLKNTVGGVLRASSFKAFRRFYVIAERRWRT